MLKLISVIVIFALLFTTGCSVRSAEEINSENIHSDCPYGNIDCEYPGDCGRYIDKDDDEICDHSQ